ncbi:hypothetical protein H8356DRAFT_1321261 [Neocallimastix lanati (nom. inval.)]|nr:hypothetical protein H8356DRAFT_1321261 [Neocallimastix sp. JGI-2020a]
MMLDIIDFYISIKLSNGVNFQCEKKNGHITVTSKIITLTNESGEQWASSSHYIFCHKISVLPRGRLVMMGLLFSDLMNHHQGRNNYTNPLIDQSSNRIIYHVERSAASFIGENILGYQKSPHINSGSSREVDPETLSVLDKNEKT